MQRHFCCSGDGKNVHVQMCLFFPSVLEPKVASCLFFSGSQSCPGQELEIGRCVLSFFWGRKQKGAADLYFGGNQSPTRGEGVSCVILVNPEAQPCLETLAMCLTG